MSEPDLDQLLRDYTSRHSVPGAAIGLLRNGTATTAYTGLADVATGEPVAQETLFAVGSLTKPMVATACARLANAGRLTFEDSVAEHVPELRDADWAQRASLRDLLANRSRLPLSAELEFSAFRGDDNAVLSRFATRLAGQPPAAPFWSYSNAGWSVIGRSLEAVTGRTWEDAMRDEVFAPLELNQTTFASTAKTAPRAVGYGLDKDRLIPAEPWTPRALGPAGSTTLSTLTDLLRFAGAHLEEPSLAVLRDTHEEIRIHAWFDAWCLGWARFDWDGGPVWGWDGVISGQRAFLRLVPEQRGAIVLLTNADTGRAMFRALFDDVMEASFGVRVPALQLEPDEGAAGDLSRFAGVYAWPDRRIEVAAGAGSLVLDGSFRAEGFPIDDCAFVVDEQDPDVPTVTFGGFDRDGRPGVLYEMLWGLPRVDDSALGSQQ